MRNMRWVSKIIFIFFCLLIIIGLSIFYLNTIFLPLQAKDIVASKASALLKRDVSIEKISFRLSKGFVLQNIRIAEKTDIHANFAQIQTIRFRVVFPNLFHPGDIFIPSVTVENPVVRLNCNGQNQWNFLDLLTQKSPQAKPPQNTTAQQSHLSVGALLIENGQIIVTTRRDTQKLEAFDAKVHLSLPNAVNFESRFAMRPTQTTFSAKGKLLLCWGELTAEIKTHNLDSGRLINLTGVPLYVVFDQWIITDADLKVHLKNNQWTLLGSISSLVNITTKTDVPVKTQGTVISKNFTFHKNRSNFDLAGSFVAPQTTITAQANNISFENFSGNQIIFQKIGDHFSMSGNLLGQKTKIYYAQEQLTGDIELKKILFNKDNNALAISAESKIANATFKDPVCDIVASSNFMQWHFNHDQKGFHWNVPNFSAQGFTGTLLSTIISGSTSGKNLTIDYSDFALKTHGYFTTEDLEIDWPNKLVFLGNPQVDLTVARDPTLNDNALKVSGIIHFTNDTLQGIDKIGEIKNLKGELSFGPDKASSKNLTLTLNKENLLITGVIEHFKSPSLQTTLQGKDFKVSLIGTKSENKISFSMLQGEYYHSAFDLKGFVQLQNGPPDFDLTGKIALDLTDLEHFPKVKDRLKQISPVGIIHLDGQYILPGLDWQKIFIKAIATAPALKIYGVPFKDISAKLTTLPDQHQNIKLQCFVYDGKFSANANIALAQDKALSEVSVDLFGFDLKNLKDNFPALKDKDLSGFLSANVKAKGLLWENKTVEGEGAILITDGKLLELEMLKGIWKVLFSNLLVEDYRKIAFTQGKATFTIKNARLNTEDLILKSIPADISARGSLGFDQTLNFDVVAKVREAPLVSASALQAVPTTIISQMVKNVVGIKLTGSLADPKIKYKILPFKILEKTTGSIFEGIHGMLEDIWDN